MSSKPIFKTRVTDMLGIEYPILAGGMAQLSRAELAGAVSNAGGLGILVSVMYPDQEQLREEIRKTRALTKKPFGVNINLFPRAPRPGVKWAENEDYIRVLIEEGVRVVETSGRSPEPVMKQLKDGGITVLHKTTAVRFALTAERVGADAVSVVGFEAAGHPGQDDVGTLVLIPRVVDSVKVPVIAGGGIADGRGLVAALALGAEAVVMGTRFMATRECPAHPKVKEMMVQAKETDTLLIQRSIRSASRVWTNEPAQKVMEMEAKGATLEQLLSVISGERGQDALLNGDLQAGTVSIGQAVGLVDSIPTVEQVVDNIVAEALAVRQRLDTEVIRPQPGSARVSARS